MMDGPDRHLLAHAIEAACRGLEEASGDESLPGVSSAGLADHLVEAAEAFGIELGAPDSEGPAAADRPARFGAAVSRILDVWDLPELQKADADLTPEERRWVFVNELVVHSWDLGTAGGIPPGVAVACRKAAEAWIDRYRAAGTIGPEQQTDSARPIDQLAAFFGRPVPGPV